MTKNRRISAETAWTGLASVLGLNGGKELCMAVDTCGEIRLLIMTASPPAAVCVYIMGGGCNAECPGLGI